LTMTLKVASLQAPTRQLNYTDFPLLLAASPRGGTLCEWREMSRQIRELYDKGSLPRDYRSLFPPQCESLCASWLFDTRRIVSQVLPMGKTLRAIDIVGVNQSGGVVAAQVTYKTEMVALKAKELRDSAARGVDLIFFAPEAARGKVEPLLVRFV